MYKDICTCDIDSIDYRRVQTIDVQDIYKDICMCDIDSIDYSIDYRCPVFLIYLLSMNFFHTLSRYELVKRHMTRLCLSAHVPKACGSGLCVHVCVCDSYFLKVTKNQALMNAVQAQHGCILNLIVLDF